MNLADIQAFKDARMTGVLVDYSKKSNFIMSLDVMEWEGTSWEPPYVTATEAPVFRNLNEGISFTSGGSAKTAITAKYVDFSVIEDVQAAQAYPLGVEAYLAMRQAQKLVGALQGMEKQMLLGQTLGDSAGFLGIYDYFSTALHGLDCGGRTADKQSWAFAINRSRVKLVLGMGGQLDHEDIYKTKITDANGKAYSAFCADGGCWIAGYIMGDNAFRAAVNIENTLDDDTLLTLDEMFDDGLEQDCFVMNKQSRGKLRRSRTATNPTGLPAPTPTESDGTEIITTKMIPNTMPVVDFAA